MGSDDARPAIERAVARWPDEARSRLLDAVDAIEAVAPGYDAVPPYSDADLDRAMAAADVVRRGGPDAAAIGPDDLAALSPDAAGQPLSDPGQDRPLDAPTLGVRAGAPPPPPP